MTERVLITIITKFNIIHSFCKSRPQLRIIPKSNTKHACVDIIAVKFAAVRYTTLSIQAAYRFSAKNKYFTLRYCSNCGPVSERFPQLPITNYVVTSQERSPEYASFLPHTRLERY
jgi:hypothetical protein